MSNENHIKIVKGNGEVILISDNFRKVTVKGSVKRIRHKESMVLRMLIESYPNQVSRKGLSDSIWGTTYVFDETINQTVKNLRIALEDKTKEIISTIPRFGYCLGAKPYHNREVKKISHARLKMEIRNLRAV